MLYFGELTVGNGLPTPVFNSGAVVSSKPIVNGPSYGLIEKGDVITGVNGNPIKLRKNNFYSAEQGISDFISLIRSTPEGEILQLSIKRGDKSKLIEIEPRRTVDENGKLGRISIGLMLSPNYERTEIVKANNIIDAVTRSADTVVAITSKTAQSFVLIIGSFFRGDSTSGLSGPIGIIQSGSQIVATNDISALIAFMAAVSLNLAVVNSIPFPGLDGGRMVFVLSEAVSGKKVDDRVQDEINAYALVLLLLLSLSTTFGDVKDIIKSAVALEP